MSSTRGRGVKERQRFDAGAAAAGSAAIGGGGASARAWAGGASAAGTDGMRQHAARAERPDRERSRD
jgi:hypothetical protein